MGTFRIGRTDAGNEETNYPPLPQSLSHASSQGRFDSIGTTPGLFASTFGRFDLELSFRTAAAVHFSELRAQMADAEARYRASELHGARIRAIEAEHAARMRQICEQPFRQLSCESGELAPPNTEKKKKSTANGDAREKIVSALNAHHYDKDGNLIDTPASVTGLAKSAGVSKGSVSGFLKEEFAVEKSESGWRAYRAVCARPESLKTALRQLNKKIPVKHLLRR